MSDDYAELKAQIFAAREIIGHLCAEQRPPRMSIPVNLHADEDMVMDAALAAADKAIDTLRAENEALRQDAERYRWLRENDWASLDFMDPYEVESGEPRALDAAIDAAMKAKDGPA